MLEENTPSSIHHVLEMNETDAITREFPFSRYETDKNQQLKKAKHNQHHCMRAHSQKIIW